MTVHEDMWKLVGDDLNGCREALVMLAEQLEDEREDYMLLAIAKRVRSVSRRLEQIARLTD